MMYSQTQSVQRGETNRPFWSSNFSIDRLDFRSALVIEESEVLRRSIYRALATILWLSTCQPGLYAQQPPKLSPKLIAVLSESTLELKDDDAPLVRLKKERFNAALKEGKARLDLYSRGLTRIPDLIEIGQRLFSTEADLYDKPDEKAEVLQRQLDVYTEAEASLEKKVKDGWATQADLERLRYDKVSVEIELFNAKSAHDHKESALQPTPK